MPLKTKEERNNWAKNNRLRCKQLSLCSYCYSEPVFKQIRRGKPTRIYSKCKRCLRKNAWFQAEYREKNGLNRVSKNNSIR